MDKKRYFERPGFDKINVGVAAIVSLITFIAYYLTVAPTLSYWDCGEFIACSYILGIPHPPGSPVFIALGRIFSLLPFAEDICYRVNMLSVLSSTIAVLFGYLALIRLIKFWYKGNDFMGWKRLITYLGGAVGALFMAFSSTFWANAVEAEVYGLSMMLMTMILWLALKYYECQDSIQGSKIIILVAFLAMLGVGVHLSTFLIMPVVSIFFILKKNSPSRAYIALSLFFAIELLAILIFSDGRGGFPAFLVTSVLTFLAVAIIVYKYIRWPILIAIGSFSMIMLGYYQFVFGIIGGITLLLVLSRVAPRSEWKTGLAIVLMAVLGFSFYMLIPIRSGQNPRIDQNNTSRDFSLRGLVDPGHRNAFVNYLERRQYGSQSMVDRMFKRRGELANQFGRHPHMGFWSYFENQYGLTPIFGLLFLLGLLGIYFSIQRKVQVALPFLIILLLGSVGLVLYMNFAGGIMYSPQGGNAYLEVRHRDYFFTPAFAYFGLALGLGIATLMELVRKRTSSGLLLNWKKPIMAVSSMAILLPGIALTGNFFENDRSDNYYPKIYAENMLDSCEKDAILFTSGDNDTFPLWCVQEVYGYRKDIRVACLSYLNSDWYIYQMKDQYNVPMSLNKDQILLNELKFGNRTVYRPVKPFVDKSRKRKTYLIRMHDPNLGTDVRVQDMVVDDIVLANKNKYPLYFSREPYAESPLMLRDYTLTTGLLSKLDFSDKDRKIDVEEGYRLFTEVYQYDGMDNPDIYRDDNATGLMLSYGVNALRISDDFRRQGNIGKAREILEYTVEKYPEYFPCYQALAQYCIDQGDIEKANEVMDTAETILLELIAKNPENQFYLSDYGLLLHDKGKTDEGLTYLWEAFNKNRDSGFTYYKLAQVLYESKRYSDLVEATKMHAEYKINRSNPSVQNILNLGKPFKAIPNRNPREG